MHAVLLVGLLSGVPTPHSATAPFTFDIPPGWTNLSSWAPPPSVNVPAALREEANKPEFVLFAANLAGATDQFIESVNATIQDCPGELTEEVVFELAKIVPAQVRSQMPTAEVELVENSVVYIGDVSAGRMRFKMLVGPLEVGQLVYLLPSDGRCATITYSVLDKNLDAQILKFDAHAKATQGLVATVQPFSLERTLGTTGMWALFGGAGALVVCLVIFFVRKR